MVPPADATPSPSELLCDPRVDPDRLRLFAADDAAPLLLVGVVHDHPASVYRARAAVRALNPGAVAVELPGLALPLFERLADDHPDPAAGGELSAAMTASTDVRRVAVDTLGPRFWRALWSTFRAEGRSLGTAGHVLRDAASVARHALACRLAALGCGVPSPPASASPFDHDVTGDASPLAQAESEHRHVEKSLSVLRAFERPPADDVVDAARERTMASRLTSLRRTDSVVAVVGFDHLDALAERLGEDGATESAVTAASLEATWGDRIPR